MEWGEEGACCHCQEGEYGLGGWGRDNQGWVGQDRRRYGDTWMDDCSGSVTRGMLYEKGCNVDTLEARWWEAHVVIVLEGFVRIRGVA